MMVTGVFANKPWDAKTFETWQLGSNSNANAANHIPYVISHFTRHFILIGLYLGIFLLRCKCVPFFQKWQSASCLKWAIDRNPLTRLALPIATIVAQRVWFKKEVKEILSHFYQ